MDDPRPLRKKITCFEDLIIWQKGIEFAKEIYLITERKGLKTDFGLKNQMRDASVRSRQTSPKGSKGVPGRNIYTS